MHNLLPSAQREVRLELGAAEAKLELRPAGRQVEMGPSAWRRADGSILWPPGFNRAADCVLQLLLEGATRGEVRGSQRCCALREIDVPSAGIAALGRGGAALRGAPSNSSPSLSSPSRSLVRRKEGSTGAGTISSRPPFLPARTGFSRVKRPPWAPRRCVDAYSTMADALRAPI